MPSADGRGTPTPRPSRYDAALAALTTALLVLSVGSVGWGVLGPGAHDAPPPRPEVAPADPVRLRVPSLRISAPVVPIELGDDQVLDPPEDASTVGWWTGSAQPGAHQGRVVITGHTLSHGTGAIERIVDLRKGEVLLTTSTGTRRYEVTDHYVVDYAEVARKARAIFGQTEDAPDGARLILVTCTDFDGLVYRSNVIVVAKPV